MLLKIKETFLHFLTQHQPIKNIFILQSNIEKFKFLGFFLLFPHRILKFDCEFSKVDLIYELELFEIRSNFSLMKSLNVLSGGFPFSYETTRQLLFLSSSQR